MANTSYNMHLADNLIHLSQSFLPESSAVLAPMAAPSATYYRSQVYTEKAGVNPLVKAAAPLLSLLARLNTARLPIIADFSDYLEHEFKAFITQSSQQTYNKEILQMAYYMLQAAFVEAEQQLINEGSEITESDQTAYSDFFSLFEQFQETLPIDLLELGYLLVNLGYRGKYRSLPDGNYQLELLRKQLYQLIREQRGEFSKTLAITENTADVKASPRSSALTKPKLIIVTTFSFLTLLYLTFNLISGLTAEPTYKELQQIQQGLVDSND